MRLVGEFGADVACRIVEETVHEPFVSAEDLARRATLERHEITLLAADSLASLSGVSTPAGLGHACRRNVTGAVA